MNVISNRLVREVEMIDCVGVTFEKSRWKGFYTSKFDIRKQRRRRSS